MATLAWGTPDCSTRESFVRLKGEPRDAERLADHVTVLGRVVLGLLAPIAHAVTLDDDDRWARGAICGGGGVEGRRRERAPQDNPEGDEHHRDADVEPVAGQASRCHGDPWEWDATGLTYTKPDRSARAQWPGRVAAEGNWERGAEAMG